MNSSHLFPLSLLVLVLSFSTAQSLQCNAPDTGSTLQVFHVFSPCSPFRPAKPVSWEDSLLQMQSNDQSRLLYFSSLVAKKSVVPIASGRQITQNPSYIVRVQIGTPPQTLLMAMDTGNDAAWVPCDACVGCPSSTVFDTTKSTTFKNLGCEYAECRQVPGPSCSAAVCTFNMTYGGSGIAGNWSHETIKLASDPIPSYGFGCIQKATGSSVPQQGLLGLGRGSVSLMSQTDSIYKSTFSYCLPSFKSLNFSGSLRLGPIGQPKNIKFTQLLRNPRRSSLYYVNLVGIKVGKGLVKIPPEALAFNPTTGSGTIIDSGTVFTRLVQAAYIPVRDEFRRRMGKATVSSLGGFDTCYTVPVTIPTMTLMFSGMNVTLPPDNFLIHSTAGSTTCLAMAEAPTNVNSALNVIANLQQQNHRILIDVPNSRLGVSRELCS